VRNNSICRLLSGGSSGIVGFASGEPRRIRVEAKADLAAALVNKRRKPVRKRGRHSRSSLNFEREESSLRRARN
jgi:hypothetical protein